MSPFVHERGALVAGGPKPHRLPEGSNAAFTVVGIPGLRAVELWVGGTPGESDLVLSFIPHGARALAASLLAAADDADKKEAQGGGQVGIAEKDSGWIWRAPLPQPVPFPGSQGDPDGAP